MARINLQARVRTGEERRGKTREKIIEAAIAVMGTSGIEAATVDDIVTKAAVARGTFYNHFEDMPALAAAVAHHMHDLFFGADEVDPHLPPMDELQHLISQSARFLFRAQQNVEWGRMIVRLFGTGQTEGGFIGQNTERNFRRALTLGVEIGLFKLRSDEVAYDLMVGACLMALTRLMAAPEADAPQIVEDTFYHLLLAYSTPKPVARRLASTAAESKQ